MLLYHCNFGYPILSEDSVLITPKKNVTYRDETAKKYINSYNMFEEPNGDFPEVVFYHDIKPDRDGFAYGCIYNESLKLGAYVRYNKNQLPYFSQWKQVGMSDYVLSLEPGTWVVEGRAKARERGELMFIQPGEIKQFQVEIGIVEDKKDLEDIYNPS